MFCLFFLILIFIYLFEIGLISNSNQLCGMRRQSLAERKYEIKKFGTSDTEEFDMI